MIQYRNIGPNGNPQSQKHVIPEEDEEESQHAMAEKIVTIWLQRGVRVVAFDMDQCLVAAHSRGVRFSAVEHIV